MFPSAEEIGDKAADTAIKKAVDFLINKIMDANGIPQVIGGPYKKFYTYYGKVMLNLYKTELRYNPKWKKLRDVRVYATKLSDEINQIIRETPIPVSNPGVMALLGPLMDPRAARQIEAEKRSERESILKVVEILDGLLNGAEAILVLLIDCIRAVDSFVGKDKPRNNFDYVFGQGSLGTGRGDLCWSGQTLLLSYEKLVRHRNGWSSLTNQGRRYSKNLSAMENICVILR
jgi:hypothetical protein